MSAPVPRPSSQADSAGGQALMNEDDIRERAKRHTDHLRDLFGGLIEADEALAENQRQGCMKAIAAVALFLRAIGGEKSERLVRPLRVLQAALLSLEAGAEPRLFRPRRVRSKRPEEYGLRIPKALAARVVEVLTRLDSWDRSPSERRERAGREIVSVLKRCGFPIKGKAEVPAWKTVLTWQANIGAGHYGEEMERYLRNLDADLEALEDCSPEQARQDILQVLEDHVRIYGWPRP